MVVCNTFRFFLFLDLMMMIGDSSSTSVATTTTTLSADDVTEQRREVLNELSKYSYQLVELKCQKYEIEREVSTRKQCWQWGFCTWWDGNAGVRYNIYYAFRTIHYWQKSTSHFAWCGTFYYTFNFFFRYRRKHTTYSYAWVCPFVAVINYPEKNIIIKYWSVWCVFGVKIFLLKEIPILKWFLSVLVMKIIDQELLLFVIIRIQ